MWDKTIALTDSINISKYNLCVFFYDANCIDNYFSQIFQNKGITTATLQHGVMLAERKEVTANPDFCGVELKNFVSNYFLAWNEFTKREALHSGIPKEQIEVLGVIKCIDGGKVIHKNNKVIGLLLDGEFEAENNSNLINITNAFATNHGYRVYLRFHPRMDKSTYKDLYEDNIFQVCPNEISLKEYVSQTEFCIVANSTAFIEMLCWNAIVYRYSTMDAKDKYRDANYPSFHTLEDLESLYKSGTEVLSIGKQELIGPTNPVKTYSDFFKLFDY